MSLKESHLLCIYTKYLLVIFFKDSYHNGDGGCVGAGDGEEDAGHDGGDANADGADCDGVMMLMLMVLIVMI